MVQRHAEVDRTAESAPRSERLRVLVVDDEPILRRLLGFMLRPDDVVTADDGASALEILTVDRSFDVILTDLWMPRMGGLELHRRLLELDPGLARRVVFCAGQPDEPGLRERLRTAPNALVIKPYGATSIRAAIAETLEQADP